MQAHPGTREVGFRSVGAVLLVLGLLAAGCSGGSTAGSESASAEQGGFCATVTSVALTSAGYRELAEVTPPPHRSDVERFAGFLADLEALEGAEDVSERRKAITSDPEYQETLQRIGNYVTEECGIGGNDEALSETETTDESSTTTATSEAATPTTQPAPSNSVTTTTSAPGGSGDQGSAPDSDDSGSEREEPAVPPDEVKAAMREIFGDRLWGTSHGYFAPDGSEYEGNVSELTEDEALSACEELSVFIAEHPDMEGRGVLRLTDITVNADNEVVTNPIAVNDTIAASDPGRCRPPE